MAAPSGDSNVKELMKRFGGTGGTKNPAKLYSEKHNQNVKNPDVAQRWKNATNKINNVCVLSKADQMLLQRRHSEIAERKAEEEVAKSAAKYKGCGSTGLLYDTTRKLEKERQEAERKARQDIASANAHLKGAAYSKMDESARLERQRLEAERKAREDYIKRASTVKVAGDFQYREIKKKRDREMTEKKAREDASKAASNFKPVAGLDKFGAEMRRLEAEKREAEHKGKVDKEEASKKYRGVGGSLQAESARLDKEQKMREKKAREDYERAASHYKGGITKQDAEMKKLTRDARLADEKAREEARKAQVHYKGGITKEIEEVKKLTTDASKADAKSREEALKAQANYKGGITKQDDVIRQRKAIQLKDKKAIDEAKTLYSKFRGASLVPKENATNKAEPAKAISSEAVKEEVEAHEPEGDVADLSEQFINEEVDVDKPVYVSQHGIQEEVDAGAEGDSPEINDEIAEEVEEASEDSGAFFEQEKNPATKCEEKETIVEKSENVNEAEEQIEVDIENGDAIEELNDPSEALEEEIIEESANVDEPEEAIKETENGQELVDNDSQEGQADEGEGIVEEEADENDEVVIGESENEQEEEEKESGDSANVEQVEKQPKSITKAADVNIVAPGMESSGVSNAAVTSA